MQPQLGDFSSYDFPDTMKIVDAGEVAAQAVGTQLAALALSDEDYARYLQARSAARTGLPKVEFVRSSRIPALSAPDRGHVRPVPGPHARSGALKDAG